MGTTFCTSAVESKGYELEQLNPKDLALNKEKSESLGWGIRPENTMNSYFE